MLTQFLKDEATTLEWGRKIGRVLKPGDIVRITGPLGAGKTTLVRGIVAGLGGNPDQVHSPTFSLVHEYEIPTGIVNHCDFYRLEDGAELAEFGGLEFFDDEKILLIEWPEKIRLWEFVTRDRLIDVDLQHDAGGRILRLTSTRKILDQSIFGC